MIKIKPNIPLAANAYIWSANVIRGRKTNTCL